MAQTVYRGIEKSRQETAGAAGSIDEIVGPGVPVHALFARAPDWSSNSVNEYDVGSFSHGGASQGLMVCGSA